MKGFISSPFPIHFFCFVFRILEVFIKKDVSLAFSYLPILL